MVSDVVSLLHTLGHEKVECVIGHDFGAVVAALCALIRPDMFRNLVLASHPFKGIPKHVSEKEERDTEVVDIHKELAALPEPRKLYKWYYTTAGAVRICPSGDH
jgi:pimeloyl-ACP methyl ester carboxylesterase